MGANKSSLTNAIPSAILALSRVCSARIAMAAARQVARMSDRCKAYILIERAHDAQRAKPLNT